MKWSVLLLLLLSYQFSELILQQQQQTLPLSLSPWYQIIYRSRLPQKVVLFDKTNDFLAHI